MSYFSKIQQNVTVSALNSSTANISGSATYSGSVDTTLSSAGIQVNFYSDKDCYIYVEQSQDTTPTGPHWDISDRFRYFANTSFGNTVQATASYFRVRVTNQSASPTSTFRLQSVLCPIVEVVPRTLTEFGSLKTAVVENVATVSSGNCKTNLTGSQVWQGPFQEVYNQSAIQVIAKFDQDFTLYVCQSQDGVNADISDTWEVFANQGFSVAVASIAPYYRVCLTNKSSSSATGQLTSVATAIFNPLPRKLDDHGHLQTSIAHIDGDFDHYVIVSPMGALKTTMSTRLAGASFIGDVFDTSYWANTLTGTGSTATQTEGTLTLATGTNANAGILTNSIRIARYIGANSNYYRGNVRLPAVTTASGSYVNTRRWGAFDATNGFFFCATQTNPATNPTLSVVCRKSSSTPIDLNTITTFNGNYGPSFVLDNNVHTYEIFWTNKNAYFVIDDVILHTFSGLLTTLVSTPSLKIGLESINSGGNTTNNTLAVRSSTINRLGQLLSQPTSKYQATTTTGVQCKYGAGNLHGIIVGSIAASGATVTLTDGTVSGGVVTGTTIASYTLTYPGGGNFNAFGNDFKGLPFSTGLVLTIGVQNSSVTVIFE